MPKAKEDYMPYLNRVARECRNAFEINDVRQQVINRLTSESCTQILTKIGQTLKPWRSYR